MTGRANSVPQAKRAKRRAFLAVLAALSFNVAESSAAERESSRPRPDSPLADGIARRYRVERSAVERVVVLAERHFPVDPALLLAIVGIESSWRPWAVGSLGEVGLCQVRPDLHGATATQLADPAVNIRIAAKVLRRCLRQSHGDVASAVGRYNGQGDAAKDYAVRVLKERSKLVQDV